MARSRTLTNLMADVRLRADRVSDEYVSDAEVTEYINQSIAELYDLLVEARGASYYESSTDITTSNGTTLYSLPADFYQLIAVEAVVNGTDRITLRQFDRQDRAYLVSATPGWSGQPLYYRIRAGQIELLPTPSANIKVTVYYVPFSARLVSGSDTFDGINGWEEYVVADAARKCATREESWELVASLKQDVEALKERIRNMAPARDAFQPPKVIDTRGAWNPRSRRASRW